MLYQPRQDRVSLWRKLRRAINGLGRACHCIACGRRFFRFSRYRGGWDEVSDYLKEVGWVSSDFDNFWCPFCRCHDRERHLILYFEALGLWELFKGARVLHIAPEKQLAARIRRYQPAEYLQGDLMPTRPGVTRMDVGALPFDAGSFDLVLCNHVLEHVVDDRQALREVYRVLKPKGHAIMQTPFAAKLPSTREHEPEVDTEGARREFYGQEDHLRLYGVDLRTRMLEAGFTLALKTHAEVLADFAPAQYGVNPREPLFLGVKP